MTLNFLGVGHFGAGKPPETIKILIRKEQVAGCLLMDAQVDGCSGSNTPPGSANDLLQDSLTADIDFRLAVRLTVDSDF